MLMNLITLPIAPNRINTETQNVVKQQGNTMSYNDSVLENFILINIAIIQAILTDIIICFLLI